MKAASKVLVTGISGFLALQIAKDLLERGYIVRGTVRANAGELKLAPVKVLPQQQHLEIVEADLLDPKSIDLATQGCDFVMHVAAPVMAEGREDEVVKPAVEGTRAVMSAAIKHKVKAVIMTSSVAAVVNYDKDGEVLNEKDWPDLTKTQPMYIKSKSTSEKMAWEMYEKADKETRPRLVVINPAFIMGPTMMRVPFVSGYTVMGLLDGTLKDIQKQHYGITDVRDVSLAHIKALEKSDLTGERFICFSGEHLWLAEVAEIIKAEFEKYGYKIVAKPQEECPIKDENHIYRFRWGRSYKLSNEKIKKVLGMEFRPAKESIIEMGYSLIKQGLVPDLIKK